MHRIIINLFFAIWVVMGWDGEVWALTITLPKDGQVFHAGETITLTAQVDSGEEGVHSVDFSGNRKWAMFNIVQGPPFQTQVIIPSDFVGSVIIRATGIAGERPNRRLYDAAPVTIKVVLPPNVTLQGLRVDDDQRLLLFSEIGEREHLYIRGKYSDGIERMVDTTASGTSFETSDPTVVTISPDGDVEAKKNGKVTITIKNGNHQLQVQTIVQAKP